jgi:hypothetical protein
MTILGADEFDRPCLGSCRPCEVTGMRELTNVGVGAPPGLSERETCSRQLTEVKRCSGQRLAGPLTLSGSCCRNELMLRKEFFWSYGPAGQGASRGRWMCSAHFRRARAARGLAVVVPRACSADRADRAASASMGG